jgi:hypothetical protein
MHCPNQSGIGGKFEVCSDDGGRDRDRTCDPYHVKKARGIEAVGNQGICVPICGNSGGCSKDVPPPVVAYDQRALPITWHSGPQFRVDRNALISARGEL